MSNSFDWLNPEDRKKLLEQMELIKRQTKPFRSPLTEDTLRQIQEVQKYLRQFQPDPKVIAYFSSLHREVLASVDVAARSFASIASQYTNPAPKSKVPRRKVSIGTHAAARRMESYIDSKGMNLTEFASLAGTTDKTLRKFRENGCIKRDVFDGIAKAMGITREELLRS
jgi:hypothetical protein